MSRITTTPALRDRAGRFRPSLLTAASLLFMLCVTPAFAQVKLRSLTGITNNEVVRGPVAIEATVTGQPSKVVFVLWTPDGQRHVIQRDQPPYAPVVTDDGRVGTADSRTFPEGKYALSVRVFDGSAVVSRHMVRFTVDHDRDTNTQPQVLANTKSAEVQVVGLPSTAKGTIYPYVRVDQPVESVHMVIPGVVDRTERTAPYGLMSDHEGKINPWNTTQTADGDYVLNITVTLANGKVVTKQHAFKIANSVAPTANITVSGLPATVSGTIYPQVLVDRRVDSVRMVIPGVLDRTERTAPYGLMSDHEGKINPWNTAQTPNGTYTLTVTANLSVGGTVSKTFPFKIANSAETKPGSQKPDDEQSENPAAEPELTQPQPKPEPEAEPAPINISVSGLPAKATGNVYAQVLVDQPIEQVRMTIPGVLDRIERSAPYGLMSDHEGQLNPLDTTRVANGDYALTVTARTAAGLETTKKFAFSINNTVPVQEPEEEEDETQTVAGGAVLTPGSGFKSATPQPGRVGGDGKYAYNQTIARWDVVPEQTFKGQFAIGVLAFHFNDIDRVEFSVEGGPWVAVNKVSKNPQTNVDEYWVKLDSAKLGDRKIEVRAVAYPKRGVPRVLESLFLFSNHNGGIQFPTITLDAGSHRLSEKLGGLTAQTNGWLIIRGKPGLNRSQVRVSSIPRINNGGKIKFENLTIVGNGNNLTLHGGDKESIWLDNVKFEGVRNNGNWSNGAYTWYPGQQWKNQYWTDSEIDYCQSAFQGPGFGIVRNVKISHIFEDLIRIGGLIVNLESDYTAMGTSRFPTGHPDFIQCAFWNPENTILYNIKVTRHFGQGFIGGPYTNMAVVNVTVDNRTGVPATAYRGMQITHPVDNLLIKNSTFVGDGMLRPAPDWEFKVGSQGFLMDNIRVGTGFPALPGGWQLPGIEVRPSPAIFD